MLTISRAAYERLSALIADRPDDVAVRIVLRKGRTRMRPGKQRQGDQVLQYNGRAVLLLDQRVARHLDQRSLGVRKTENGPRLRLQRAESEDQIRGH